MLIPPRRKLAASSFLSFDWLEMCFSSSLLHFQVNVWAAKLNLIAQGFWTLSPHPQTQLASMGGIDMCALAPRLKSLASGSYSAVRAHGLSQWTIR